MKRAISALITTFMILTVCSCGGASKVLPESFVEFEVEDYIAAEGIEENYTYETKHSYDTDSKLDTVEITITIPHKYADEIITGKCFYYYDKASDIWERARTTQWGESQTKYIEKYLEENFTGPCTFGSGYYDITIHNIDFNKGTVNCTYFATTTVGWNTTLTVEGTDTFAINHGTSFQIPGEKGYFYISFNKYSGIMIWGED